MTIKEFFSFKHNRFFWINIIGMVIVIAIVLFATSQWLDNYTMHGHSITVPDLDRMSVNDAEKLLEKNELKYIVTDSSYMKGVPAGTVLQQTPLPGKKVKEGRTIYLTISTTEIPMRKLPDIINNSSIREAEARLKASGFRLDSAEYVTNEAKDWVLGVRYRGRELNKDSQIPEGSTVTLVVGDGNVETVPDSINEELDIKGDYTEDASSEYEENSWF